MQKEYTDFHKSFTVKRPFFIPIPPCMSVLVAQNISKSFQQGNRSIEAIKDISLAFDAGEFAVIWGSSGSGKSTLLSILAGLDTPSSGKVILNGQRIDILKEDELSEIRKTQIGFIFQSFHLIPSLTAQENVSLPLELQKDSQAEKKARMFLERVGLGDRMNNFSHQLSGGEQQRVAIARALIAEPKILFADEPTGSLDEENSTEIFSLLLQLQQEKMATLIMVTHEKALAEKAQRIITLHGGTVAKDTKPV